MKVFRALIVVAAVAVVAACSSTPSAPAAPAAAAAPKAPAAPAAPAAAAGAGLTGAWMMNLQSPQGAQDWKMNLTQTGSDLKGVLESPFGNVDLAGSAAGKDVKFSGTLSAQGQEVKIDFIAAVDAPNSMAGKAVFGSFGEGTFTAKKTP